MSDAATKGPASYFPSIEKKYGQPIAYWQQIVRDSYPAKHMEIVERLKHEYELGHGHANAVVAHTLAQDGLK
jgi:hypothetical protein